MVRPALSHLFERSPLRFPGVEIVLIDDASEPLHEGGDDVWAKAQVINFEPDGSIRDIIEQTIRLAPHPNLLADPERVARCLEAHVEVLGELFARPRPDDDSRMPVDLLHFDDLLGLRKAMTREDFATALRARKRLGRLLG